MANVNKVVINRPDGEEVLIDLTGDSVAPETLGKGVTAHDKTGAPIVGTMESGGGAPVEEKDVNFYDYDGTLLYSYTVDEAQALTELPPLPEHEGLICQGWNWTLETIKTYNRDLDIGALYVTDDESTRLYLQIDTNARLTVPFNLSQSVSRGVEIDWGDNSPTETFDGTGNTTIYHEYQSKGQYKVVFRVSAGCLLKLGHNSDGICILGGANGGGIGFTGMLTKIEMGARINLTNYAADNCYSLQSVIYNCTTNAVPPVCFRNCYSLKAFVTPTYVTTFGNSAFNNCTGIKKVVLHHNFATFGSYEFSNESSMRKIVLPNKIGTMYDYSFNSCGGLTEVFVPASVKNLTPGCFAQCAGVKIYDFSAHTTVPTLANTNVFSGIAGDCIFKVPAALLDTWKTATNWVSYEGKIVAV